MKLSPEARQKRYEYRCVQLTRCISTEPLKSVTCQYDSGLTKQLVAGWCAGILEAIHGGPVRAAWWIIRHHYDGLWYSIKGSVWRFWQKRIMRKSNDDLWAMLVSEGHDPDCMLCQGKGEYVTNSGETTTCDCYVEEV